jgi:hypothetical protein
LFLNICQFLCIMNKIDLFFYFFLKGCGWRFIQFFFPLFLILVPLF